MRKSLDRLYHVAMVAAVLAMVAIAVLVFVQVAGRILDRTLIWFGADAVGLAVPSLAEIGGFLFVASAFLALPATLRAAGHVRVTMLAAHVPAPVARVLVILVLAVGLALATFAAWHAGLQAFDSWEFNSVSYGMIRIPLWLPQGAMTVGLAIFAVSLLDELLAAVRGNDPAFVTAERAKSPESMDGH